MKKAQVLVLGTVLLSSALFSNSAFAKEKETSTSFFSSFSSQVVAPQQEAVVPQSWSVVPVEGQTTSSAVAKATVQNGWVPAPLEDQPTTAGPVEAIVKQGWTVAPAEDAQPVQAAQQATVAPNAWTLAPVEDAPQVVINGNAENSVQYGWSLAHPDANSDKE